MRESAARGRRSGRPRTRCRPRAGSGSRGTANGASAVDAWVMRAGCSIRLSTPPRLSASFQIFVRPTTVDRLLLAPEQERDHAAEVPHLARGDLVARVPRRGRGRGPRSTRGWRSRKAATAAAFVQCRSMRTASVFSAAQHEPGVERAGHRAERLLEEGEPLGESRRRSSRGSRRRRPSGRRGTSSSSAAPTSAPSVSGCWRYGVANVLSTTTMAPTACAASAAAWMSTRFSSGFVGDSSQTSFVRSSTCSARLARDLVRREERERGSPSARRPA